MRSMTSSINGFFDYPGRLRTENSQEGVHILRGARTGSQEKSSSCIVASVKGGFRAARVHRFYWSVMMKLLVLYVRCAVAASSREGHLCAPRGAATEHRPDRFASEGFVISRPSASVNRSSFLSKRFRQARCKLHSASNAFRDLKWQPRKLVERSAYIHRSFDWIWPAGSEVSQQPGRIT